MLHCAHGGYLCYHIPPISSIRLTVLEQIWSENFHCCHGVHLGYQYWTILLCCPDAFHQISAQSDVPFGGRQPLKIFKGLGGGHLGYRNNMISAILNLHVAPNASYQVFAHSDIIREQTFKLADMAAVLDVGKILNIYAVRIPPLKLSPSDLWIRKRCRFEEFQI